MNAPSDAIDIEAGLRRDHLHRVVLTVCRYSLATLALIIGAAVWSCDPAACADEDYWRGRATGCEAASP